MNMTKIYNEDVDKDEEVCPGHKTTISAKDKNTSITSNYKLKQESLL